MNPLRQMTLLKLARSGSREGSDDGGASPNTPYALIVAEVAQAHDGSLGLAHAYVDAIASTGADAVKFQVHIAEFESTPQEPWRVKFSPQDATRYDYWKRMEFSEEQWMGLREHVAERGLLFVGSPFSMEALDLLVRQEADLIKIASGEVYNTQLLDAIAASNIPAVVSSGMSTLADLDRATRRLRKRDVPFTLLQCTSEYPCPAEHVGLNLIPEFKLRYRCPVGLSDHSGTVVPGVVAAYLGIDLLEIHVTMSREMFGPDVVASVTTDQLRDLVAAVRFAEALASNPVNKDTMATELGELRKIFGRSLVAARDLPCGTRLGRADLAARKPGGGLPADGLEAVLGRALVVDVAAGHQIGLDMLES